MAKKKFFSQYENKDIERILETSENAPFVLYYDKANKLYRFFRDKARRDAWVEAYTNDRMTPEIAAYEFTDPFIAPAPYTMSFLNYRNNVAVLEGTKGVNVEFEFQTVDGNNQRVDEFVDVIYTFTVNGVSQSASATYAPGTHVTFLADDYLRSGMNAISIVATGRQTGVMSSPLVLTYYVVSIGLETDFNVAKPVPYGGGSQAVDVVYRTWGAYNKTVEFYIDSVAVGAEVVSGSEDTSHTSVTTRSFTIGCGLSSGKHHLQMRTRVNVNGTDFYTKTLYREFIVDGMEQTQVTISVDLPSGTLVDTTTPLVLTATQYEQFRLDWGYYTSLASQHTASVTWALDGSNISTRDASIVDASNEVTPDPIVFAPDVHGEFTLSANIAKAGGVVAEYQILISKNAYIEEYTNGLIAKFSALGRSNDEPSNQRNTWTYTNSRTGAVYRTTFSGTPFNSASGWRKGLYLQLQDGAYAVNTVKPLADSPVAKGATIEFVFETYNVKDTESPVICVNTGTGASIRIYGNKAVIRSLNGSEVKTEFNEGVRLHMAFIVTPTSGTSEPSLMFIQTNGVRERSNSYAGTQDSFTTESTVRIGDPTGKCGVRVYAMKFYGRALDRNSSLNNYIIESGNISAYIVDNDILSNGAIDIDKLKGKYDTIAIEGAIDRFFDSADKTDITGAWVQRTNPNDPSVNFTIVNAVVGHPGQSTLGYSKPQLRIKCNPKDESILYGPDGESVIQSGYLSLYAGQIPEKKARLNPNFVDSTCANAGGFFSMVNDLYPLVQVNGDFVLRNAADSYARTDYQRRMGFPFPYTIQTVPQPTPVVVIWRKPGVTEWSFLSMFTMLDEKKSPRKFGQRSIYDKVLADGTPDPFDLYDGSKGNRLWDNTDCIQFEIINNNDPMSLFQDVSKFYDVESVQQGKTRYEWQLRFEQEYPDNDDTDLDGTTEIYVGIFHDFAVWMSSCYNNQTKFNNEWLEHLDPWKCAAYYILAMKNGMADSMVRNMELRSDGFDAHGNRIWFPIWWDTDVQKGKRNDGQLAFPPRMDRQTPDPDTPTRFCFEGHGSTFWNSLEGNSDFMNYYVPEVNTALTKVGFGPEAMMNYYRKFSGYYSERVYNESIQNKYIEPLFAENPMDYLSFNIGNGENHDRWWIYENHQYWDARLASGAYTNQQIKARASGTPAGSRVYFKVWKSSYFAWGLSDSSVMREKQVYIEADGQNHYWTIPVDMTASDPLCLFGVLNISEIDLSALGMYYTAEINLSGAYDPVLGSVLKVLKVGVTKEKMRQSRSNRNNADGVSFGGLANITSLETLDMQGLRQYKAFPVGTLENLTNLKQFYAAGSGLTAFSCAPGLRFTALEFPDTLMSIAMVECQWSSLKFFDEDINEVGIPSNLRSVSFTNMGRDTVAREFVLTWLRNIDSAGESFTTRTLAMSNVMWDNFKYEDLLLIGRIPQAQRPITGTIMIDSEMTSDRVAELSALFGEDTFTHGSALIISGPATFILNGPREVLSGETVQYNGYSFPLEEGTVNVVYRIVNASTMQPITSSTISGETVYSTKNATLYSKSGKLVTTESAYATHSIRVQGINAATGASSYIDVSVKARTYPTAGSVTGPALITTVARHTFGMAFTPAGTNGSVSKTDWTYPADMSNVEMVSKGNRSLVLNVNYIDPDRVETFVVGAKPTFTNNKAITLTPLTVTLMLERAILEQAVNAFVMDIFWEAGLSASQWQMMNTEAFKVTSLPVALKGVTESFRFSEIKYFGALTSLDMAGSSGLQTDIDASLMTGLKTVNLSGIARDITFAENVPLTSLHLGKPKVVTIHGATGLTAANTVVDDPSVLNSVEIVNTTNKGFGILLKMIG